MAAGREDVECIMKFTQHEIHEPSTGHKMNSFRTVLQHKTIHLLNIFYFLNIKAAQYSKKGFPKLFFSTHKHQIFPGEYTNSFVHSYCSHTSHRGFTAGDVLSL